MRIAGVKEGDATSATDRGMHTLEKNGLAVQKRYNAGLVKVVSAPVQGRQESEERVRVALGVGLMGERRVGSDFLTKLPRNGENLRDIRHLPRLLEVISRLETGVSHRRSRWDGVTGNAKASGRGKLGLRGLKWRCADRLPNSGTGISGSMRRFITWLWHRRREGGYAVVRTGAFGGD
jgi:hypothetical protein